MAKPWSKACRECAVPGCAWAAVDRIRQLAPGGKRQVVSRRETVSAPVNCLRQRFVQRASELRRADTRLSGGFGCLGHCPQAFTDLALIDALSLLIVSGPKEEPRPEGQRGP